MQIKNTLGIAHNYIQVAILKILIKCFLDSEIQSDTFKETFII